MPLVDASRLEAECDIVMLSATRGGVIAPVDMLSPQTVEPDPLQLPLLVCVPLRRSRKLIIEARFFAKNDGDMICDELAKEINRMGLIAGMISMVERPTVAVPACAC